MNFDEYEVIKVNNNENLLLNLDRLSLSFVTGNIKNTMKTMKHISIDRKQLFTKAKKLYEIEYSNKKLMGIDLRITYNCNFNCQYCFQQNLPTRYNIAISQEYIDKIFLSLYKVPREKDFFVHISGGEPLLPKNFEIVKYILQRASSEGYKIIITTNGYNLNYFTSLLRENSSSISYITVSIDGIDPIQSKRRPLRSGKFYSFSYITDGIKSIEKDISINLNVSVDLENLKHLDSFLKFLCGNLLQQGFVKKVNIGSINKYDTDYKRSMEEVFLRKIVPKLFKIKKGLKPDLQKRLRIVAPVGQQLMRIIFATVKKSKPIRPRFRCWVPLSGYTFDPYGNIYLCGLWLGKEEGKIGRYYPNLEFNENYYKFVERSIFTLKKCKNCKYVFLCGGGCPYLAYIKTGDPFKPDCSAFIGKYKEDLFNVYFPYLWKKRDQLLKEE